MSSMRILLLVLALALVAIVAKYTLTGSLTGGDEDPGRAPATRLENVREDVRQIEDDLEKAAQRAREQLSQ
jgi:hypothetical protein